MKNFFFEETHIGIKFYFRNYNERIPKGTCCQNWRKILLKMAKNGQKWPKPWFKVAPFGQFWRILVTCVFCYTLNIICETKVYAYKNFLPTKFFFMMCTQKAHFLVEIFQNFEIFGNWAISIFSCLCLLYAHHEKKFFGKKFLYAFSFVSQIIFSVYRKPHVTKIRQSWPNRATLNHGFGHFGHFWPALVIFEFFDQF